MTDDVKVFSNLYDEVVNFDSKEEFNRYYAKHKETVDKMATRGLNVKYKIKGYKIGRSKGDIILYPLKDEPQPVENTQELTDETGLTLHQKMNKLNDKIKNVENLIKKLFDIVLEMGNEQPIQQPIQQPMQQRSMYGYN